MAQKHQWYSLPGVSRGVAAVVACRKCGHRKDSETAKSECVPTVQGKKVRRAIDRLNDKRKGRL